MPNGQSRELTPEAEQQIAQVVPRAVAGQEPQFKAIFEQAFTELGQGPNAPPERTQGAIDTLANNFARRVFQNTGQVPNENQIRDFVAGNLNKETAKRFLQGTLPDTVIQSELVDPFVQERGLSFGEPGADDVQQEVQAREQSRLRTQFEELFGRLEEQGIERLRSEFAEPRRRLAESEAALGRSRSPVSRAQETRLAGQEQQALSQLIGGLTQQRIGAELGVSGRIENLLERERRAGEVGGRFQQELGFRGRSLREQITAADQDRRLRALLGQGQLAEMVRRRQESKPGLLTKIGQGVGIAKGLTGIGADIRKITD